jgi:parvulin-like peptidyl-prolyl isomerase
MAAWSCVPTVAVLLVATPALPTEESAESAERGVVARVNGQAIRAMEVDRELRLLVGETPVSAEAGERLKDRIRAHLIDRQLALAALDSRGLTASEQDIDQEVLRLQKQVTGQGETLEQYLGARHLDMASLRRLLAWRLAWGRYLEQYLTDDNLRRFFDRKPRHFDGTTMRVAHILWNVDDPGNAAALDRAVHQATRLRERILDGELSFAEAATEYSAGPSAREGGEVGVIGRHQPMSEPFSQAAFALDVGQISPPVVSPAGVHLIRCLEVKPGTLQWQDVRAELREAATQYLFRWLAERQRKQPDTRIEVLDP